MDRVRRFQRSLITALTGINTLVFSISNHQGIVKSFVFAFSAMLVAICCIQFYALIKRNEEVKRIPQKSNQSDIMRSLKLK